MRTLFDTNILLDIGLARKPFADASIACFVAARETGGAPCIAPHTLATFYYIVAHARGKDRANVAILDLITTSEIVPFTHETAQRSVALNFSDFEDAMIAAAAEASGMDCILTRNGGDFKKSPVPALSPEAFLAQMS